MSQPGLFSEPSNLDPPPGAPLAERIRPRELEDLVGQDDVLGPGTPLRAAIDGDRVSSLILWGPPGSGKTTLARIIARKTRAEFVPFSAVLAGIKEIKAVMAEAEFRLKRERRPTILFIDEIHRFNKAQQDAFLPHVESGNVILIGATTENPSFEVNAALLSRCRVLTLRQLRPEDVLTVLNRALTDPEHGIGELSFEIEPQALEWLARQSNGDARFALNVLEAASALPRKGVTGVSILEQIVQRKALLYDKAGEQHFNLISALHKSLRNSDADAALYWLSRMLEAGEDGLYVARRLVRFASEDVGLADPQALAVTLAAKDAFHFIGLPEGKLALAEAVLYLAAAPKSNAVYRAYAAATYDAFEDVAEPVPLHLRNAPTGLMKDLGYGRGYEYAHDFEDKVTAMECLPERLSGKTYYRPGDDGFEKTISERLAAVKLLRARIRARGETDDGSS